MKLNYWFLTATLELCLAVVLILADAMKAAAFAALVGTVFIVVGMARANRGGAR
jgi:hypothetical protein